MAFFFKFTTTPSEPAPRPPPTAREVVRNSLLFLGVFFGCLALFVATGEGERSGPPHLQPRTVTAVMFTISATCTLLALVVHCNVLGRARRCVWPSRVVYL